MKPEIREVAQRQSAKPRGANTGAISLTDEGQQTVGAVSDHVQPGVKALEEPDDDGGQKNHGKGPL